jgi:hypothetical protein
MCRLSLSIIAAASTVAFVQAASAADLPRKAPPAPAPVAPLQLDRLVHWRERRRRLV